MNLPEHQVADTVDCHILNQEWLKEGLQPQSLTEQAP